MRRSLFLSFLLSLAFTAHADPAGDRPAFPVDRPIETRMDLGLFGLLGGGMEYSIQGKPLRRYEDFKAILYTAGDEKAAELIREAEDAHFAALLFYGSGVAVGVDVALAFKPTPLLGVDGIDRAATGLVAAQVFWALGILFDSSAEARKFNAVQRHNHRLADKGPSAWEFVPPSLALGPTGGQCCLEARF